MEQTYIVKSCQGRNPGSVGREAIYICKVILKTTYIKFSCKISYQSVIIFFIYFLAFQFAQSYKHSLNSTYRFLKQLKQIDFWTHVLNISVPSPLGSIISPSDLLSDNFCVLNRQRLNSRGLLAICLEMWCSYGNLS